MKNSQEFHKKDLLPSKPPPNTHEQQRADTFTIGDAAAAQPRQQRQTAAATAVTAAAAAALGKITSAAEELQSPKELHLMIISKECEY